MQEMPPERNQNLQTFMVSWTIPPEPRTLGTCVSAFMVPKNTPYFSSKGVGISICTCYWARDFKKIFKL